MNVNNISRPVLLRQLLELGVEPGRVLIVHTAFSKVGPVEGRPGGTDCGADEECDEARTNLM